MNKTGNAIDLMSMLHVAHAAENAVELKLNNVGLTMTKLVALRMLAAAGEPVPLGQLAGQLSCVKSNITQLVDRLEADGFVARTPDPHDRRTRLATLTAAGRRACQQGSQIQRETELEMGRVLSESEAEQLAALLAKMSRRPG